MKRVLFLVAGLMVVSLLVAPGRVAAGIGNLIDWNEFSIHVNIDEDANDPPDSTSDANDHGCNDSWASWYNAGGSAASMGVWATNSANQAHIWWHNGLDGYAWCESGMCDIHLCGKDGGVYDIDSHRLSH